MPAESSSEKTASSRPVPASAPLSAGPSVRVDTVSISGGASGSAASGSSSQALSPPKAAGWPPARRRPARPSRRTARRARSRPSLHRQRALARAAVGVDVAHVVDHEDRRRPAGPPGTDSANASQRQLLGLHEVGADHGHHAEEQEHEQLAEALVAVRARAAGVEHAGDDRGDAHHQQLPARHRRQVDARGHRDRRTPRRCRPAPAAAASGRRRSPAPGPSRSSVSAPRRASE